MSYNLLLTFDQVISTDMTTEHQDVEMSESAPAPDAKLLGTILCVTQWNSRTFTIDFRGQSFDTFVNQIADKSGLPPHCIRLTQNGKPILREEEFDPNAVVRVEIKHPLPGGKGGFGSLLRSMKPKVKGDENFDACRDLSGRRLRTV